MFISREGDQAVMEYAHLITDDRKECGFSVLSSAHAEFTLFKETHLEKTEAIVFTDGAMCYSGKYLCLGLIEVSKWTGLKVVDFHIGEAGKNKTELDGQFATAGSIVNRGVAQGGKDVRMAVDVVRNLEIGKVDASAGGSKTTALSFRPDRTAQAEVRNGVLKNISRVSHRSFKWGQGLSFQQLVLFNQSNIGVGRVHSADEVRTVEV